MASTAYPMTPSISMLHDRMDTTERRRKRPPNTGSQLLDNQENYFLFSLLGPENVSLYAAVVELLSAENRQWTKTARGVVSLVKDYQTRAYFLRLYDLIGGQDPIWQFRLYKNFQSFMSPKCNQLLTFEGEDGQVYGLNFSSQDEARNFKGHLDKRYEQERKTMAARETRAPVSASTVFSNVPPPPSSYSNGVTPVGTIAPHVEKTPVTSGGSFFNRKKKKDKKPRIRKEDISNPTNFQHKAHVGWDQDSGFSNNVDSDPMDESIKEIIRAAGQDPNNLSKKTIKFVYDFIERYEDTSFDLSFSSVASPGPAQFSRQQAPPPPVPLSQPISQWNTPPPAPPSRGASYQSSAPPSRPPPPPPSTGKFNSRPLPQVPSIPDNVRPAGMPPPPPPMGSVAPMGGSIPPPPPPPPPISSSAPAPPPPPPAFSNSSAPAPPSSTRSAMPAPQSGRGDLLAQIQAGKQLRSVAKAEESKSTGGSDSRDDVMAQIRLGANLKHVDQAAEQEKRKSGPALAEMGGIAGALAKALEERRMNMCIDSSDDEEESDEKNEWSD